MNPPIGTMDLGAQSLFSGPGDTLSHLRTRDWSETPLGPVSGWPAELLAAVRTVLSSKLPMMIWWGSDLVQIYNDALVPLLGDKHPAALSQRAILCWPEAWADVGPLAASVMAGEGATLSTDFLLFLKRHGYMEETYWTFSYSPIVNDANEVLGILVATTDVTGRVVGERRLGTVYELGTISRAELHTLNDAAQAALKIMSRNRPAMPFAACYLLQGGRLELADSYGLLNGTEACPLTVPLDASLALARVARTGRSQMFDLRPFARAGDITPSPLGNAVPTLAMLSPVTISGEDDPAGVLVMGVNPYRGVDDVYRSFFDLVGRQFSTLLTDSRAHEQQRRRAEMLAELHESKTRFFHNVSHEFRTPLTLVLGALGGPLAGSSPDEALRDVDAVDAARRAALHLDRLVDALLTFAQAEGDALVAHRKPTDIAGLTQDCASMFRSAVELAGLSLTIAVPSSSTVVDIDSEMWSRIVLNLLSNAYKFTPAGGIDVRLKIRDKRAELEVKDSGIGIEEGELDRVFERFHQVASARSRTGPGAGIGLALVADLVSAHDGQVKVESVPGQGSTFKVSLPLSTAVTTEVEPATVSDRLRGHVLSDLPAPDGSFEPALSDEPQPPPASGGRHILVVEDNDDLRRYIVRLLRSDGWEVTEAPDAESALALTAMPDLVLSDIMLPGLDGLALVRMLRANPDLNRTPVILLTARAGAESAATGLRAGADDYIVKPFEPAELLARLAVHHELAALRNFALDKAENRSANLELALRSNRQIGAAIGILMALHKLTSEAAFAMLREASNKRNRSLRDVADQVVLTGSLDHGTPG
jgi:signal transduction histidine kinase/DNA-binding response OmpR family regulator